MHIRIKELEDDCEQLTKKIESLEREIEFVNKRNDEEWELEERSH